MSEFNEAKAKLDAEKNPKGLGRAGNVMAPHVRRALLEFCRQSEVFAGQVARGRSFEECMKAVEKNVGGSISDLEAYRRAVQFYAPESSIRFRMELTATDGAEAPHAGAGKVEAESGGETPGAVLLDLTAFL